MSILSPSLFVGQYKLAQSTADNVVIQSYINRDETKTLYRLLGKELADIVIAYYPIAKTTATSGLLIVGIRYTIVTYVAGDDFTNVGATTNVTGESFVATGTTPTTWTNASSLTTIQERLDNIINPFYIEMDVYNGYGNDGYGDFWNELKFADSHGILDLLLIAVYYEYLSEEQIINTQSGVASQVIENGTVQSNQNAFRKGEQKWNNGGLDTWYAVYWYCKWKYPDTYPEFKGIVEQPKYSAIL